MARWQPPTAKVGDNEHIGRRMFDEPLLAGASGQPIFRGLLLNHFQENRGDEYSLDRLGDGCADKRVVRELEALAVKHGSTFHKPKRFDGWAVLRAKQLSATRNEMNFPVLPSPVSDIGEENIYHAHVVAPPGVNSKIMALSLRHLFTTYGRVEPASSKKQSWYGLAYKWLTGIWLNATSQTQRK